ncbi:MAG TPA: DUF559 domain-containing protein [Arenimonas sp.]|uniref:endonuclease domain-containing protein n=1 Tax=Arenimonas sp. TaxID=1872635 RepID=UPI002C3F39E7|nr:DUF559 domain-containing protein [Arenimonas sp.]HMB58215.1 DUF559 domain-containing protein [Arenimonas sp.]
MSRPIKPPLPRRTLAFARQLRSTGTDAEGLLWYHLRAKRFQALKWRRQHPLPPHIVDFYCHAARLVVEIDGGQHEVWRDAVRTEFLVAQGLSVLRFWNNEMLGEKEAVLEAIFEATQRRTLSPSPSPGGRGE